jgi:hypothetical protein
MMFVAQRRIEIIRFGERGVHSPTPLPRLAASPACPAHALSTLGAADITSSRVRVRSGYSRSGASLLRAKAPLMITAKDTPRQIPWGRFTLAKQ